jgi:hypothetical protein
MNKPNHRPVGIYFLLVIMSGFIFSAGCRQNSQYEPTTDSEKRIVRISSNVKSSGVSDPDLQFMDSLIRQQRDKENVITGAWLTLADIKVSRLSPEQKTRLYELGVWQLQNGDDSTTAPLRLNAAADVLKAIGDKRAIPYMQKYLKDDRIAIKGHFESLVNSSNWDS